MKPTKPVREMSPIENFILDEMHRQLALRVCIAVVIGWLVGFASSQAYGMVIHRDAMWEAVDLVRRATDDLDIAYRDGVEKCGWLRERYWDLHYSGQNTWCATGVGLEATCCWGTEW
jgi:hypothetical protein